MSSCQAANRAADIKKQRKPCGQLANQQYIVITKSSLESSWIWGWAFVVLNRKHVQNSKLPPVTCSSYVQGNGTLEIGVREEEISSITLKNYLSLIMVLLFGQQVDKEDKLSIMSGCSFWTTGRLHSRQRNHLNGKLILYFPSCNMELSIAILCATTEYTYHNVSGYSPDCNPFIAALGRRNKIHGKKLINDITITKLSF